MVRVGSLLVHVRIGGECLPGVIVAEGRSARVRVFRPSGIRPAGTHDAEADYRHASDPLRVPTPDGGTRPLPTWHEIAECGEWEA